MLSFALLYLLAAAFTGGRTLGWTVDLAVWVWGANSAVMTLLGLAVAFGLAAALVYPRYRRGMVMTRTVLHAQPTSRPPDDGTPLANYLAGLVADRWRDNLGGYDDAPLADVVDLGAARDHRRAA
ncbi:hypothetical protein ACFPM0_18790 [Pseudonocardia sulfidoxydans]|uniref:hypothetical protein n=1 Tax=Pseudonocardia sulfidoxydans TaxID=54011 RepID=UPI00361FF9B5